MSSADPTTEGLGGDGTDHTVVRGFRLAVVAGPDKGKIFASAGARTVIGTADGVDVVLTDRSVSRFHCEISLQDGRISIRDLGSTNGTFVESVAVGQAFLTGVAIITLGRTRFRFDPGTNDVTIPLSPRDRFGVMVGASRAMRQAFALLERAAASDTTVLLEGETGTGKEAAAESIHRESARRDGPFVVVDCGAIPANLLETELFGHEKGAFTGAVGARKGAFEEAHKGTIFLDEIGELPAELQPKLLRVLARHEVKRVGSSRYFAVDVRVVAATNRSLRREVNAQRFRPDLYYRLAVLEVRLPPLRERAEDLRSLTEHLLADLGATGRPEAALLATPAFQAELARHSWPGNVRELRNYVERCLTLHEQVPLAAGADGAGGRELTDLALDSGKPLKAAREAWTRVLERRYLEDVLRRHDGNVAASARAAGVDRIYFYRLLWKHGIR